MQELIRLFTSQEPMPEPFAFAFNIFGILFLLFIPWFFHHLINQKTIYPKYGDDVEHD